jgi:hypothetical protein
MRANNPRVLVPVLLGVIVIAVASNVLTGGKPYSNDLKDLQTQFNNDRGKVRLLMLLSPT